MAKEKSRVYYIDAGDMEWEDARQMIENIKKEILRSKGGYMAEGYIDKNRNISKSKFKTKLIKRD